MKNTPVNDFADAVRAVTQAIDRERLVRGEATNRTETVEQLVKREYERYLTSVDDDGEEDEIEVEPDAGDAGEAREETAA